MINEQSKKPDLILAAVITMALVLGILILSSASATLSQSKFNDSYYLIKHQLALGIIPGIFLGFLAYKIPLEFLRKIALLLLLVAIFLLALVFVPGVGFSSGGAQRWVHFGFISIQPAEVLKPIFIIYLASWLASRTGSNRKNTKKEFGNTLAAFLMVVGLIGSLLLKQPDLSTFCIVAMVAFAMYFLSGTPLKHTIFIIGLGVLSLLALIYFEPYRFQRVYSWLWPETDPLGKGFQANQALVITGSGGAFGHGFGSSSATYVLLPELIGDSIFASYAQELGFIGGLLLAGLFVVFAWRGFSVAAASSDKFKYLVACGITIWITLQAVINISSTIGLIPLSGIPLPFVSYGGTAIAMELIAVGLLLNISRQLRT